MPVQRLVPTQEAADLLALPGRSPGRAGAEGGRRRGRRAVPARGVPHPGRGRPAGPALRRGARRRRAALRGLPAGAGGDRRGAGPASRVGRQRARAVLLRAGHEGHRASSSDLLPDMLGGELLGAYCLSEPHAGSDPAAMRTTAVRDGDSYVLTGEKAWVTHGGQADFYTVMARDVGPPLARHLLLPGPGRQRRARRRPGRAEDGPDRLHHRADALRRRPGRRRPARWARRARACRSRWPGWTPAGWASPRSPSGWPRARWTTRWPTPRSARPSASRSSSTRAWRSCWPTWPPRWRPPGP